jgi:hypothetical protein
MGDGLESLRKSKADGMHGNGLLARLSDGGLSSTLANLEVDTDMAVRGAGGLFWPIIQFHCCLS